MTQNERRIYLIKELQNETAEFKKFEIPANEETQRKLLRALFNIRPPYPAGEEFLKIQDEYLKKRALEKGITDCADLKSTRKDPRLYLWQGDITTLKADVIVNAANSQMLGCWQIGHNCVDNSIHSFAGVEMRIECNRQMQELKKQYGADYQQPTAVPMITPAYNLPAKYVIHVVGPIVDDILTQKDIEQLTKCYDSSLALADQYNYESISFCCISTGLFMFPQDIAAKIAIKTAIKYLDEHLNTNIKKVIFNVFKDSDLKIYNDLLNN